MLEERHVEVRPARIVQVVFKPLLQKKPDPLRVGPGLEAQDNLEDELCSELHDARVVG